MARTTFYVTVEPTFGKYNWDRDKITKITAKKITQSKPATGRCVKLTLDIPDSVFLPLVPEAVITVPTDLVAMEEISVEAVDPHEE